jgi:hypothetical protein
MRIDAINSNNRMKLVAARSYQAAPERPITTGRDGRSAVPRLERAPVRVIYRRALALIEAAARESYRDDRVAGWAGSVT